jgi:Arc/MetJ-type ribon-helix-helix transcriptional regulator
MTIHLPTDLERLVQAEVQSGNFASADELVAEAVRHYIHDNVRHTTAQTEAANGETASQPHKPIWEVIAEENRSIPPEVWDALPTDLSEQHDHYIYGTPKRPTT